MNLTNEIELLFSHVNNIKHLFRKKNGIFSVFWVTISEIFSSTLSSADKLTHIYKLYFVA